MGVVVMDRRSWGGERSPWGWRGGETTASAPAAASRLDRALRRLAELPCSASEGPPAPEQAGALPRCHRNPPAVPDAIAEAELRVGTALPADYFRFLLCCDGAILLDASGMAAELLGTAALARHAEEMECFHPARCIPEVVVFATVGREGDRLAFETGRMNPFGGCGVLDARRDYRPDQWWVIARDFTSWLEAVLWNQPVTAGFGRLLDEEIGDPQPELPLLLAEEMALDLPPTPE